MIHRRPRPPQNIHNRLFVDILAKNDSNPAQVLRLPFAEDWRTKGICNRLSALCIIRCFFHKTDVNGKPHLLNTTAIIHKCGPHFRHLESAAVPDSVSTLEQND